MVLNKKGAMEMSINLIIIIIVALTVLGLVLGFVVSKFNEADTQFEIKEKLQEADYKTPITFSGGTLYLKPNKPTPKRVSIYNYANQDINLGSSSSNDKTPLSFSCLPNYASITTESLDYSISPGTTDTTQVVLTASGTKGEYMCKAMIKKSNGDTLLSSDVKLVIR